MLQLIRAAALITIAFEQFTDHDGVRACVLQDDSYHRIRVTQRAFGGTCRLGARGARSSGLKYPRSKRAFVNRVLLPLYKK